MNLMTWTPKKTRGLSGEQLFSGQIRYDFRNKERKKTLKLAAALGNFA